MVVDVPYQSLEHTLKALKVQVADSLDFASNFIPSDIQSPGELFDYLKPYLHYRNDPKKVELLQSFQTLMNRGGKGDCDCFTIAGLASCVVCDFKPLYVALAGNSIFLPTHIYLEAYDLEDRKICALDFTNQEYDFERPYKFKQRLLFRL